MSNLHFSFLFLFLASFLFSSLPLFVAAQAHGEDDIFYKYCVAHCKESGCVDAPWYSIEPLYNERKRWDCENDCQYHCMQIREEERKQNGENPVKYHGKWAFQGVFGIQEPVAAALSALNVVIQFKGCVSFLDLVYLKLPLRPNRKTYYEYTGWWQTFGVLSTTYWLSNAILHCKDVEFTRKLDLTAAVSLLGFSLLLVIVRAFKVRNDAARTTIAAPFISLVLAHIQYLNSHKLHKLDHEVHIKVFMAITAINLLAWAIWAFISKHPGQWRLWMVVIGGNLAMLLEIYEFPPIMGYVDSHALWHATAIPITYLWWSFVRGDAVFRTLELVQERHLS